MSTILLTGHLIGIALGVGGATMSDVLFFMSASDNKIDCSELKLLKIASKVVTLGLFLLCVSGIGFIIIGNETSPRFFAKMSVILILSLNGMFMHKHLMPILDKCTRNEWSLLSENVIPYFPLFLSAGVVSAVSWYTALLLGLWRSLSWGYAQIMGAYGLILVIGVATINFVIWGMLNHPKISEWIEHKPIEQS